MTVHETPMTWSTMQFILSTHRAVLPDLSLCCRFTVCVPLFCSCVLDQPFCSCVQDQPLCSSFSCVPEVTLPYVPELAFCSRFLDSWWKLPVLKWRLFLFLYALYCIWVCSLCTLYMPYCNWVCSLCTFVVAMLHEYIDIVIDIWIVLKYCVLVFIVLLCCCL